ncbi:mate-domain-containing protein [Scenedesmus sp. NREL 46B-D3]|nr:mate-domain-containing protein [Scenedesmus sp. NREL 46B-D3]
MARLPYGSPRSEGGSFSSWQSYAHLNRDDLSSSVLQQTHPANVPLHQAAWFPKNSHSDAAVDQQQEEAVADMQLPPSLLQECTQLVSIAGPLFIEGVAAIGEQLVATAAVGQLPEPTALPALVMAQAIYNVSGYSIVSGLASALETLCGQAFGARNYHLMPVMLIRAQLVCLLCILPTVALWGSGSLAWLLPLIGQDPALAVPSSRLLQLMLPSLLLSIVSETVVQFLLAQGEAVPGMVSCLVGLAVSPAYSFGLVWGVWGWQGLGLQGAGVAAVAVQGTLVAVLMTYLLYRDCWRSSGSAAQPSGWQGLRLREAARGWCSYLHYGLPCVAMVCLEWWVWEVLVLMAGLLPDAETAVAVMGLSTQLSLLPWMFCYSLGTATATRIAQALGGGSALRASRLLRVACGLVLACSVCLCAGVWLLRGPMIAALTRDVGIQQQLKQVLPVVVAAIICDGQVAVMSGCLRAAGRQGVGALVNWAAYWAFGLPVSWLLGFKLGWGVMGLRWGLTAAAACHALALHWLVACKFDWQDEVRRARQLVGGSEGEQGDEEADVESADVDGAVGAAAAQSVATTDAVDGALSVPLLQ